MSGTQMSSKDHEKAVAEFLRSAAKKDPSLYEQRSKEYSLIGENKEDVHYLMDIGEIERAPGDTAFPGTDDEEGIEE